MSAKEFFSIGAPATTNVDDWLRVRLDATYLLAYLLTCFVLTYFFLRTQVRLDAWSAAWPGDDHARDPVHV